jgi:hypothetical protein
MAGTGIGSLPRSATTPDMQKLINQLLQRKIACLFSLLLILSVIALDSESSVESRWGAMFSGVFAFFEAFVLWFLWIAHFVWLLSKQPRILGVGKAIPVALVLGVLVFFVAGKIGGQFEATALKRDIQPAVDAGLYKDCMQLLQNWPTNRYELDFSDPDFTNLPTSIKMLEPAYVGKSIYGDPPNIGICKNGFGGFAMGIRVFRTDEDAIQFSHNTRGDYLRVASGIYIWWHPT